MDILLYELLCGHPPFEQTTHYRLLLLQLANDPPDLLQVCPTVNQHLATVVMQATRPDPARRSASIEALHADLVSLEQVTPVVYRPDPPPGEDGIAWCFCSSCSSWWCWQDL